MKKAQYQYPQFKDDESIRILTLEPGRYDDPLIGRLEVVPIDAPGSYEALSYVWTDAELPKSTYEILIRDGDDEEALLAFDGGSIFAALRSIRRSTLPRRIWADQCCINQKDRVERSQQVKFMNRIYRDATQILVWLGLDTHKVALSAFGLVHDLDRILGSPSSDPGTHLEMYIADKRKPLQALTDRPWFKRGWIVQEIGTGTPATMIWGKANLDWDRLASVCEKLKSYHYLRSTLGITTSDISFLYRRFVEPDEKTYHANRFNFVYELQRARHLKFSDDRDRIFAFLGHFSISSDHPLSCGPLAITTDYTKTVEETYINTAIQVLQQSPASLCIVLAAVQHAQKGLPSTMAETEIWIKDKYKLPSWVPDWRWSEGIILAEPICPHDAYGGSLPNMALEEADLMLRVYGVRIDVVRQCSGKLSSRDFYTKKTSDKSITTIEWLWKVLCGKADFNLSDTYLNSETAFFAFMQTLSNGCVQAAGHESTPYHQVPKEVWLRKAARYLTDTHQGSNLISQEIKSVAEMEESESNWDRWATSASAGRVFAMAEKGYYVLGPSALEEGDIVCVLFGCKVPFCLRPMGGRYLLVGECYVHGIMDGEAMDILARNELQGRVFDIV